MSVIIRLQKLPLTANASDVRSFFNGLSIPDGGVHIVGGEMGDAFIAFSTDEDARQAMALNGGRINNESIMLLLSSRAEMQKVIDQARKTALSYMQLSMVVPASVGNGSNPTDQEATTQRPIIPVASSLAAVPNAGSLMPNFSTPPPSMNPIVGLGGSSITALKQQPQPPVISLAGFMSNAKSSQLNNTTLLPRAAAGTVPSTFNPLVSQGSSYNEIPGLSFISSTGNVGSSGSADTSVASMTTNGLTGWLSALNGQLINKGRDGVCAAAPYLNGGVDTSFLANSATPLNNNGQLQTDSNNQSPWKFLKKDQRSPSPSRERGYRRDARSRSSSRERDLRKNRRSRSSSRGRSSKRDGRSGSSSRDRGSRSWSRGSSRDYNRRHRDSRSRSSSRDRFGRTRQRSRSRSPRHHRSRGSRDGSREQSGGRYDREGRHDVAQNRGRFSHFSGRASDSVGYSQQNQNQQDQWSSLDKVFTGNSKPVYASGMNRQVEPIFGLHTAPGGPSQDPRSRFAGSMDIFPARSGKISPAPSSNLVSGGLFRSTSPLPDSVYSVPPHFGSASNNSTTTSDYAVKLSNLETVTGYGEIRRFFKSLLISTQGIKMINDQNGRRTGVAYVQFLRKEGKRLALLRDGTAMRKLCINIESITDQEFEQAVDSFRPGSDKGYQQQQQQHQNAWNEPGNAPWNSNSTFRGDGPWNKQGSSDQKAGNDVIEILDDQDAKQKTVVYVPTSALMVWNLPTFTTEQDIMKMFSDFTVVEVLIVRNYSMPKQLDGYVRFHRQEDAREAWSQLHRHYIANKKVTVRMCPEIDYAVAKNEYENPSDTPLNTDVPKDREGSSDERNEGRTQHSESPSGRFENDRDTINRDRNDCESDFRENNRVDGSDCNERRTLENDNSNSQERRNDGGRSSSSSNKVRTNRWNTDTNWDEGNDQKSAMIDAQRRMDSDGGAGSDTNASWVDRDPGMDRDARDNSQASDSNHFSANGGGSNCANSRDPRRQSGSRGGRSSFGGNSVDNSELFQRTTCLLLRNVDFNVYEEDVFQFFAQGGFHAKSVLLVRNERGKRTGECLVEFETPSAAAHAESKSSQNLGRRKVFASHLDRGQVAELMKRFDAISENRRSPSSQSERRRGRDDGFRDDRFEDPEESQGVGCGPYRTSTVGLLNLAYKTTVEDVQNFFREFDLPLENVRRRFLDNGQPTGEAMVCFRNHQDAEKALNEYQNRKLFGRNVRIRLINDD